MALDGHRPSRIQPPAADHAGTERPPARGGAAGITPRPWRRRAGHRPMSKAGRIFLITRLAED